jgi:hypothetical protein
VTVTVFGLLQSEVTISVVAGAVVVEITVMVMSEFVAVDVTVYVLYSVTVKYVGRISVVVVVSVSVAVVVSVAVDVWVTVSVSVSGRKSALYSMNASPRAVRELATKKHGTELAKQAFSTPRGSSGQTCVKSDDARPANSLLEHGFKTT